MTRENSECPRAASDGRKMRAGAKSEAVRERAILALLSTKSLAEAAERSGVSERTLRRWASEDEAFKRDLATARQACFAAGMHRIQGLTGEAVDTLAALLAPEISPAVRLGAARTIAELGLHQQDAETILRKLDEIESVVQREQQRG